MNDAQIDEAERLLSYYECHGAEDQWASEPGIMLDWTGDAVALLRDMLPDRSAFKVQD